MEGIVVRTSRVAASLAAGGVFCAALAIVGLVSHALPGRPGLPIAFAAIAVVLLFEAHVFRRAGAKARTAESPPETALKGPSRRASVIVLLIAVVALAAVGYTIGGAAAGVVFGAASCVVLVGWSVVFDRFEARGRD